ncbi:MAG: GNAT family N-acetyltransferase [Myxococcota bacterium]|jgi:GNAT superfamily N-acetyltransferase|nr:GNAT family N-acetyltransferase [Myxococcota bacterium]
MKEIVIRSATVAEVMTGWRRWGMPVVTVDRVFSPADVQGIVALDEAGAIVGLLTVYAEQAQAEIVSLDSFVESQGVGTALLEKAETALAVLGIDKVRLVTTNDNLRALRFFLRHGYRLLSVHLDAVAKMRMIKPSVGRTGKNGLPLLDMWELQKTLVHTQEEAHSLPLPQESADDTRQETSAEESGRELGDGSVEQAGELPKP